MRWYRFKYLATHFRPPVWLRRIAERYVRPLARFVKGTSRLAIIRYSRVIPVRLNGWTRQIVRAFFSFWFSCLVRLGLLAILQRSTATTKNADKTTPVVPLKSRPSESFEATNNPILIRLRETAARDLFSWLDVPRVPAPYWRLLNETPDPGEALVRFIRCVGCDPDSVRGGAGEERERFAMIVDIFDDLSAVDSLLDNLAWRQIQKELYLHNFAGARRFARRVIQIGSVINAFHGVSGLKIFRAYEAFIDGVRLHALWPLKPTDAQVEGMMTQSRRFLSQTLHYAHMESRLTAAMNEIKGPTQSLGRAKRKRVNRIENRRSKIDEALFGEPQCDVASLLAQLERLVSEADSLMGATEQSRTPKEHLWTQQVEEALAFFGFAPGIKPGAHEVVQRWRLFADGQHPDVPSNADEREAATKRFECGAVHFEILRRAFEIAYS